MKRLRKELLVLTRGDGAEVLASPAPGRVRWTALPGQTLAPGSIAGVLYQGGRVFDLVAPAGVRGQLREVVSAHPWRTCGHGAPLAVLGAVEAAPVGAPETATVEKGQLFEVRSPTHGTFYQRPRPGEPTYVSPGQDIEAGATLGLVEVMKCFSPITFEPPRGASRGRVREVLANDSSEVRADEVLLRIEIVA